MKTKAMKFSVLMLVALFAILPAACKKESNDPNIDDREINKTMTALPSGLSLIGRDSLDLDMDGVIDIKLNSLITDSTAALIVGMQNARILSENTLIDGVTIPAYKELSNGTSIDSASVIWSSYSYLSGKGIKVGHVVDFGIHGKGDKFIAFLLYKTTNNYLYGWIKVNLSDDTKTFVIKELAVQKVINKPIKVGEK